LQELELQFKQILDENGLWNMIKGCKMKEKWVRMRVLLSGGGTWMHAWGS
jgi:hypothetical protein